MTVPCGIEVVVVVGGRVEVVVDVVDEVVDVLVEVVDELVVVEGGSDVDVVVEASVVDVVATVEVVVVDGWVVVVVFNGHTSIPNSGTGTHSPLSADAVSGNGGAALVTDATATTPAKRMSRPNAIRPSRVMLVPSPVP